LLQIEKYMKPKRFIKCEICRMVFQRSKSKESKHNFCSRKCYGKWKTILATIKCSNCDKEFVRQRKNRLYCSDKCQYESMKKPRPQLSGKKHWNWKGGITDELRLIRRSLEYRDWRFAVYKRDNYTCNYCKKKLRSGNIVAHHIKGFSEFEELRFDIDNGITLCRSCHKKVHNGSINLDGL